MEEKKVVVGDRKLKGFYVTIGAILIVIETSILFGGISFTGDNVVALVVIIGSVGGAFFGANFGEHFAKAKAANGHSAGA